MNTKKILGVVAVLALVAVAMVGAGAATTVMTGAEFLATAQDGVITLSDDITISDTANISSGTLTINLAGHTLTTKDSEKTGYKALNISGSANVTINGPGIVKSGTFAERYGASVINCSGKDVVLNINSATVQSGDTSLGENKYNGGAYPALNIYYSTVNVTNSTIKGSNGTDSLSSANNYYPSGGVAVYLGNGAIFNVVNSTITGGDSKYYNAEDAISSYGSTITIDNSTITGGNCSGTNSGIAGDGIYADGMNGVVDISVNKSTISGGNSSGSWLGSGLYLYCRSHVSVDATDSIINGGKSTGVNGKDYGCAIYIDSRKTNNDFDITLDDVKLYSDSKAYDLIGNGTSKPTPIVYVEGALTVDKESGKKLENVTLSTVAGYEDDFVLKTPELITENDNVTIVEPEGFKLIVPTEKTGDYYEYKITGPVAQIGDVKYYTLKDAVAAVEAGQTIKILVDEINLNSAGIGSKGVAFTIEGLVDNDGKAATEVKNALNESASYNDVTIKNFKFTGENGLRWCYVNAGYTFICDNCIFEPTGKYGIHFDSGAGNVVINNSYITGTVAIGEELSSITFNNCKFEGRSGTGNCNMNFYNNGVFNNCDFSNDYLSGSSRGILILGNGGYGWADGKYAYVYLNNCTVNGTKNNTALIDVFRTDYIEGLGCIDSQVSGEKFTSGIFVGNPSHANLSLALLASKIADGYTARVYNDLANVWEVVTATQTTLIYNANGGTSNIWNDTGAKDRQVTVTSEKPVRTGYTFANWNTDANGNGTSYNAGAQFNLDSDTILYAQWTPNNYTVTFNNNGGSGVMNAQQFTYGTADELDSNTFTNDGYTFSGWATSANGSVVYADKQSICDVGDVILYAVWTENAKTTAVAGTISNASGNVIVELKQGNTVLETLNVTSGSYTFTNKVADGTYNVVATDNNGYGKTVTVAVVINDGQITGGSVEFPTQNVNSIVVIAEENNTPNVTVANVDNEAKSQASGSEQVTITATVAKEVKADVPVTETEKVMVQDAISKLEEEKEVTESQVYYDLSVEKNGSKVSETNEVLAFSIPCDANMKVNGVVRYHNDEVQNLTETNTQTDATYQNVGDKVVIYAKCFSVYAITYSNADPSVTTVTMNVAEQYEFSVPEAIELMTTAGLASHGEVMLKANPGIGTKVSIKLATQADDTTNHVFYLSSDTSNENAKYSLSVSQLDGTTMLKNVLTGSEQPGYASSAYADANNIVLRIPETGITTGQKYFLNFKTEEVPSTSGTYTGTLTFNLKVES